MTVATDQRGPITRSCVELADPDEVGDFLEDVYGAHMVEVRPPRPHDGPLLTHVRADAGLFVIDRLRIAGELRTAADPIHKVVTLWPSRGRVAGRCAGLQSSARAGEITLSGQPHLPRQTHCEDLCATVVLLDPTLVADVAAGDTDGEPTAPIQFSSLRPAAGATQLWQDTVSYVRDVVLADDSRATPLVVGHASRLLAAVTASAFPNSIAVPAGPVESDDRPELLRRALDYIDAHVASDISLGDIAAAVHVTPRALQYMFRRHLQTTPLQYLRQIRLHRAHHDLLTGNRATDTVAVIAARWGFAHTGRFAVQYRQTYGQSPHTTLRG
ncbi:helix-turn-helix transcriptional regulator [Mycolicibacterium thermoresistibile]